MEPTRAQSADDPGTPAACGDDAPRGTDESFLDGVLDRAVAMIQRGEAVDVGALIAERPGLEARVREQVGLAESITPRARGDVPTIAGYTILVEAGRGGMGTVYLARQDRLGGRAVALKVLSGSSSLSAGARRRFRLESEAVARLRHPNIVAVHDVAGEGSTPAYAMEWVEGKSLAAVIERVRPDQHASTGGARGAPMDGLGEFVSGGGAERSGVLGAETYTVFVCRVGVAIARALAEVHRAGLLHRDVKPSNILIRRDGVPLLTDFGLAREQDATLVTQAGQFLGTPAYASPEQLRGEGDKLDARSDVYSLGATLYHALALRVPFGATTTAAILRQIEAGKAAPLRAIDKRMPRDLETIVAKAMEVEPSRRYATADELAEDLERLLSLRPIRARRAGVVARGWKLCRRNRSAVVGLTAGSVGALVTAWLLASYVFVVPGIIDRHLSAARVWLINPRYGELVYIYRESLNKQVHPDQYAEAIARYDSALREYALAYRAAVGRAIRSEIALERDTVAAARNILSGEASGGGGAAGSIERAAPSTAQAIRAWAGGGRRALDPAWVEHGAAPDLRSLGLLAYLCLDAPDAIRAWERSGYDMGDPPDPLVHAGAGQVFVELNEPRRAVLRLERARALLPGSKVLTIALAQGALRCGETALAERMVGAAGECDRLDDPFDVLLCTRAELLAARSGPGDFEEACRLFDRYASVHSSPDGFIAYAEALSSHGDQIGAMGVYRRLALVRPEDPRAVGKFVQGVERCWGKLDAAQREALRRDSRPYREIWDVYQRVRAENTPEQLCDPGDGAGAAQVEVRHELEAPASESSVGAK